MDEELAVGMDESSGGGGGKLKTIILIAVVALVIGAVGFFAGKMLSGGGKNAAKTETVNKENAAATETKTEEKAGETKTPETATTENKGETTEGGETATTTPVPTNGKSKKGILALDTFTVNLNDPFGRRYIETVINLIVDNKEIIPKITENELLIPKIRHEIFMTISTKSYNDLKSVSGKITLFEEIMMRVNEILKEEMGIEPVVEVIETKFLIQ